MKGNRSKKALSIILLIAVMSMALSFSVSARYQYIGILSSGLSITSSGLAEFDGVVRPSDSSTNTTLIVELQKKSGTNSWSKDESWSTSGAGMQTISLSPTKYVVRGTYRVVVIANIYSSSGSLLETQSCISPEVTY